MRRSLLRYDFNRLDDLLLPGEQGTSRILISMTQRLVAHVAATHYVCVELHDNEHVETATGFLRQPLAQLPVQAGKKPERQRH